MENLLTQKVYTVSELTYTVKNLLEAKFSHLAVKGEISNLKLQSSGHIYFSLKDPASQLSAVLFKGSARFLKKPPKEGDQVILIGEISVYPPRGGYQMIVREIHFLGLGELLLKFHQLKEELKDLGYFDAKRKKPLPFLPERIGVVTSPTGAAIQDILKILKRRHSGFKLLLNPVKVQGEGAAEEIAAAIADFNKYNLADVLIVGRGGGSLEDLWAFNEKIVAEAVFQSKIPIISAVGHETDTALSDFVADLRAPTPSAAAEMVIPEKKQLANSLLTVQKQMEKSLNAKLETLKIKLLAYQKQPLLANPGLLLAGALQKLDESRAGLDLALRHFLEHKQNLLSALAKQNQALNPKNQLKAFQQRLQNLENRLVNSLSVVFQQKKALFFKAGFTLAALARIQKNLADKKEKLARLQGHLTSLSPNNLLKKGYTILFKEKDQSVILSSKSIARNERFWALLSDGKILAKAEEIYGTEKPAL
ncbi:MAG: exodeoxyribonuclease VII large subunit [Parachlamydiales bacterium]|jgi:exodeoxyribonuclease VII large subunit